MCLHPYVRGRHLLCYVLERANGDPVVQWLRLALSKGPNRVSPTRIRTETDPVSETLCSVVFRIPDDERS
jgi:hypothetical protein